MAERDHCNFTGLRNDKENCFLRRRSRYISIIQNGDRAPWFSTRAPSPSHPVGYPSRSSPAKEQDCDDALGPEHGQRMVQQGHESRHDAALFPEGGLGADAEVRLGGDQVEHVDRGGLDLRKKRDGKMLHTVISSPRNQNDFAHQPQGSVQIAS